MTIKRKAAISALLIASFALGGFAFNACQKTEAAEGNGMGHKIGLFRMGRMENVDKDSPEWQERMEERKEQMEEWKNMSAEERQAKMQEMKAEREARVEEMGPGPRRGHFPGLLGMFGPMDDKVSREFTSIENGIQVRITSDDSEIVQRLQEMAAKINESSN